MVKYFKKLNELIKSHKQIMRVVGSYDNDHKWFMSRLTQAENLIKDRTDISANVHFHGRNRNQIIVTGRYKSRDYVQVFTLADNDLRYLIEHLREMERFGVVDKVDSIMDMRAVIKRELKL